jgi:transposase, IS5 family
MNLFDLVPALSMELDPVLTQLDQLLDDDTLFQAVKADLAKRYPRTFIDRRPSTPVEVILRMLIVKHLYHWSYQHTEQWVSDSLVLRQFSRIYTERVPDDTTLIRWANLIQPATLHDLLNHVVDLARQRKVTRGRYAVLSGNPDETAQLPPSLDHHIDVFAKPARVRAGDRKLATAANERYATKQRVKQVVLPRARAKSARRMAHEQQRWFRRGRNWRAGFEGRISGLKRGQGLDRCRYHGDEGMERCVGLGLIAHDLHKIAQATAA